MMKGAITSKKIDIEKLVMLEAKALGVPSELHIEYVCKACCRNPDLAPDISKRKGCEELPDSERVKKWVSNFFNSYENRYKRCKMKESMTIPDPALEVFLSTVKGKTKMSVRDVLKAHRLAMSSENIIGNMLELFLSEKLSKAGWVVAWGSTISHVDLCSKDGQLLQVKNRDNSENSSSKTVRDNHSISFWFRSKSLSGETNWPALHQIIGVKKSAVKQLNEEEFQKFIVSVSKRIHSPKRKKVGQNECRKYRK